jgi:hypothetical protein
VRRYSEFIFVAVIVDAHLLQLDGVCHPIPGEIVASVANPQFVVHPEIGQPSACS